MCLLPSEMALTFSLPREILPSLAENMFDIEMYNQLSCTACVD